jgi:hypothetical protein
MPTLNRAAIFHLPRYLYSQARPQARYRVASSPTEFSDHAIYYSKISLKKIIGKDCTSEQLQVSLLLVRKPVQTLPSCRCVKDCM